MIEFWFGNVDNSGVGAGAIKAGVMGDMNVDSGCKGAAKALISVEGINC